MKFLNRVVYLSKGNFGTCNYPEYVLRQQKERKIRQKSNLLFLWKSGVEVSNGITLSFKKIDFGTPILLTPSLDTHNVILDVWLKEIR